jgi:hypothetical protein
MYSKKTFQFITLVAYKFIFWEISLLVMHMPIFNFQNTTDMHKEHACQNFQLFCFLNKTL